MNFYESQEVKLELLNSYKNLIYENVSKKGYKILNVEEIVTEDKELIGYEINAKLNRTFFVSIDITLLKGENLFSIHVEGPYMRADYFLPMPSLITEEFLNFTEDISSFENQHNDVPLTKEESEKLNELINKLNEENSYKEPSVSVKNSEGEREYLNYDNRKDRYYDFDYEIKKILEKPEDETEEDD